MSGDDMGKGNGGREGVREGGGWRVGDEEVSNTHSEGVAELTRPVSCDFSSNRCVNNTTTPSHTSSADVSQACSSSSSSLS